MRDREMSSFDIRSKKRIQTWKKAAIHFSLCFVMGFFTGFAPATTASLFSPRPDPYQSVKNLGISAKPVEEALQNSTEEGIPNNITTTEESSDDLLIVITTLNPHDPFQEVLLMRLAHTLRLVTPPLLWIVVEMHTTAPRTADTLRRTGTMYRHLTYAQNFTDFDAEADHQKNVALNHIESHRLNGIVHFADVSNIYDLEFFEEIREIEAFGAWPVMMVSANRKAVVTEGPICKSSKVVGWQLKDSYDKASDTTRSPLQSLDGATETKPRRRIKILEFAFNSSILWDPERWGRASSVPDTLQDSVKFVQEVVLEDETKLRAIPSDCSKIMLWHLHIPK